MPEQGPIFRYMAADHDRLDGLLHGATGVRTMLDRGMFDAFRRGLLRHIGMEEKVLLPQARAARGGVPLPAAARLRLDHGAIAALLVLPPTRAIAAALRAILGPHNEVEEAAGGVYEMCEDLAGDEAARVLERLCTTAEPPVTPYNAAPVAIEAARRAVARAGYDFDALLTPATPSDG